MNNKILIYQVFTRLYGNRNETRNQWGSYSENGSGKFNDFDRATLKHIKDMGFSHIWFTGVLRHATQTDYSKYNIPRQHPAVVKGKAGSPYAVCDYYDVDPDLAVNVDKRMQEFESLVNRAHKLGLKVIIDFVPNHVARQYESIAKPEGVKDLGSDDNISDGFNPQNNFYYCPGQHFDPYFDLHYGPCGAEHCEDAASLKPYKEYPAKSTGNDHFDSSPHANDWYETVKLNYGVDYWTHVGHFNPIPDTWNKMTDILLFWAKKGVDGFRCDMAEMVPAAFWSWAIDKVKFLNQEIIFVGEVYDPNQYRNYLNSGFDYLYDKVGMYDTMRSVICNTGSASYITGAWQATDDIKDHMLYFLENHDEQRIASDFFAASARKGIPGLVASVLMQSNPFMLYAGEEYGERGMDAEGFSGVDGRTTIFDYWSIGTLCRAANGTLTPEEQNIYDTHLKVLQIARNEKAIDGDFYDLMYVNPASEVFDNYNQYAFLRKKDNVTLLIVCNFSDAQAEVSVKIPQHAIEFLNIKEKKYNTTDLLTGEKMQMTVKGDQSIAMTVAANSARVWKLAVAAPRKKKTEE
ncbi:MAG: alpha amylase C-terminal domain-containing protein [Prevotella sp.]|nr:alpha amylase C-terminal domain-containing protein [Prevotella sp.]